MLKFIDKLEEKLGKKLPTIKEIILSNQPRFSLLELVFHYYEKIGSKVFLEVIAILENSNQLENDVIRRLLFQLSYSSIILHHIHSSYKYLDKDNYQIGLQLISNNSSLFNLDVISMLHKDEQKNF